METGWFSPNVRYQGSGLAEFSSPPGTASGRALGLHNEDGGIEVVLEQPAIEADIDSVRNASEFLRGNEIVTDDEGRRSVKLSRQGANICTRLRVTLSDGILSAEAPIPLSYNIPMIGGGPYRLGLDPFRLDYRSNNSSSPKYWVMPLWNFVAHFGDSAEEVAEHPLRITRAPAARLIRFQIGGLPAFIEPLPDYADRISQLRTGKRRTLTTAVLVAEVLDDGSSVLEPNGVRRDLLSLLALATGRYVPAPWTELRDSSGDLLQRTHLRTFAPVYRQAAAILTRGMGSFLTSAQKSKHYATPYLRASTWHLTRAADSGTPYEDRITHVARTLNMVCKAHGLGRSRGYRDRLDEDQRRRLIQAERQVAEAARIVESIRSDAEAFGATASADLLRRLERQLQNAFALNLPFGDAVVRLLTLYQLPDSAILDDYYRYRGLTGVNTWSGALSKFRGLRFMIPPLPPMTCPSLRSFGAIS